MKRMAKISILLVIVLIGAALSSCAGQIVETKVTLKITAGSEQIFNGSITVTNEDPTVLQIVKEAVMLYELRVVYDAEETRVKDVGIYRDTKIDNVEYYWEYKINGVAPETGRASTNIVKDGDTIEYVFATATALSSTKVVYGTYDSSLNLFSENSDASEDVNDAAEDTPAIAE